jgi:hypothetical protein
MFSGNGAPRRSAAEVWCQEQGRGASAHTRVLAEPRTHKLPHPPRLLVAVHDVIKPGHLVLLTLGEALFPPSNSSLLLHVTLLPSDEELRAVAVCRLLPPLPSLPLDAVVSSDFLLHRRIIPVSFPVDLVYQSTRRHPPRRSPSSVRVRAYPRSAF